VFDGKVDIQVDVNEATSDVKLHAKELQFSAVTFKPAGADSEPIGVEVISQNLKEKTVTFTFPEVLPVGAGVLEIEYTGILNNQMAGFYRSSYTDIHGNSKIMASTQFESIDARRCFPCWDEPGRKAVFAVTLVVPAELTAFSNMPEKDSRTIKSGTKILRDIKFMDSPKMSTYLLAFVIGEFDFVQSKTQHGVLVRVYTPPGRNDDGIFALDTAVKCLDNYDDFFGLPYPLLKLDMVAIPEFAAGAMENWGLVTYREVDLLIDMKTASNQQKQRVCTVVTHELAHQWFGNLVTMAWWDDLWLNEGFASWCENYAADQIFPNYQMWDQFGSDTLAAALRLDGLKTSHPIQVPIREAEEVEEVFDAISYCKGASVIRMAHAVMGHQDFQTGLKNYMRQWQYGNTETHDLWAAWSGACGRPIQDMMASWTEQMGFPLLMVTAFKVEGQVAKLSLEQSWFLSNGEAPPEEKTWSIPLFIRTLKETGRPLVMMTSKTMDIEVPISSDESEFVLINEGFRTPMRVSYTAEMRTRIVQALKAGALPPCDRAGLVMDAYALAKAGKLAADELLRLLTGFTGELDYIVWDALSQVLLGFQKILMGSASEEVYQGYMSVLELLVWKSWEAKGLGWVPRAEDGHLDGMLRGVLLKLVSRFAAGPSFLEEAKRRFHKYCEDPKGMANELPDEYRVPVFQVVLQSCGCEEHSKLMDAFKKLTTNVDQKHVFLSAGFAKDPALKRQMLEWSIGGEVKKQDFFYIMSSVSQSSKSGLDMTWEFLKSEFSAIRKFVKDASPSIMDAVIQVSTSGYCSTEKAAEIEKFFQDNPCPSNQRKVSQVLEEIRGNAAFASRALATDIVKSEFWSELRNSVGSYAKL